MYNFYADIFCIPKNTCAFTENNGIVLSEKKIQFNL